MLVILGFMNDGASLFLILISYTNAGFVLFIYMANSYSNL